MKTLEIFPSVVATDVYYDFDSEERVKLVTTEYEPDRGCAMSKDTYILDSVPKLKEWIQSKVNEYAQDVMCINDELIITQSWTVIHSGMLQKLYTHRHSNSIISGSFYVVAPEGTQGLTIHKNSAEMVVDHPLIDWEVDQEKAVNRSWLRKSETFSAEENKLILFQSNLAHGVYGNQSTPRCVLAFNTWFSKGFGRKEKFNWLPPLIDHGKEN